MKKRYSVTRLFLPVAVALFIAFTLGSCTSSKQLNYFKNLPDSTHVTLPSYTPDERVILNGDKLTINFWAKGGAAEVLQEFNRRTGGGSSSGGGAGAGGALSTGGDGYLVVADSLEFPYIGKVKATGLTSRQLKETLTRRASPYLKDPIVDVDFVSFRITVLGDVRNPGTFSMAPQRNSLFEALAAAGDLQRSARRGNVKLYRETNGANRTITTIDLHDKSVLYNKDVFQTKPNDVLYVQTGSGTLFRENFAFIATIFTLLLSVASLGLTIYNNNK